MVKKLGVRQIPATRQNICHGIGRARNKITERNIAVKPLVEGLDAKQVSCRARCSSGAFSLPEHRGHIIVGVVDGAFAHIGVLSQDVVVGNRTRQFQITVANRTRRIVIGNQIPLNPGWKFVTPENGNDRPIGPRNEMNSTHTHASSIAGT